MLNKILTNRLYLTTVLIMGGALLLTAYTKQNQSLILNFQKAFFQLGDPLISLVSRAKDYTSSKLSNYVLLRDVSSENQLLRQELQSLELTNNRLNSILLDQSESKRIDRFSRKTKIYGMQARVIAYPESNRRKLLMLNRGAIHGVKKDQVVVSGKQVVGQTVIVNKDTSIVMTVIDPLYAVEVKSSTNKVRGTIFGQNTGELLLDFIGKQKKLIVDEQILTSGIGELYPQGFVVGTVTSVIEDSEGLFQKIEVTPGFDYYDLNYVLLVERTKVTKNTAQKQEEGATNES